MDTKFGNRKNGYYHIGGQEYPSVTTILQSIAKSALYRWHFNQGHLHGGDWDVFNVQKFKTMNRGSDVHALLEAHFKKSHVRPAATDGYQRAALAFLEKEGLDILPVYIEQQVVSKKYGFAGTLDLAMFYQNKGYVCDFKTGKGLYPEVALQLSAYSHALYEMGLVTRPQKLMAILFKEDGTYQIKTYKDEFKTFLAVKKLWTYLNEKAR